MTIYQINSGQLKLTFGIYNPKYKFYNSDQLINST